MSDKKTVIDVLKKLLNAAQGNESSNTVGQHVANQSINQKLKELNERNGKKREHYKK